MGIITNIIIRRIIVVVVVVVEVVIVVVVVVVVVRLLIIIIVVIVMIGIEIPTIMKMTMTSQGLGLPANDKGTLLQRIFSSPRAPRSLNNGIEGFRV